MSFSDPTSYVYIITRKRQPISQKSNKRFGWFYSGLPNLEARFMLQDRLPVLSVMTQPLPKLCGHV